MIRNLISVCALTVVLVYSGCATCGPCGREYQCNNCDGYNTPMARNMVNRTGRALTCGAGCGEIYVGEWRNSPPDVCNDCDVRGGGSLCRHYPFLAAFGSLAGRKFNDNETCYGGGGIPLFPRGMAGLGMGCGVATDCDGACGDAGCAAAPSTTFAGPADCASCQASAPASRLQRTPRRVATRPMTQRPTHQVAR